MDPSNLTAAGGNVNGGAFVWSPTGSPVTVHIDFDVVDRLNFDVMRGFGAVPKRGAEVGGLLLGWAETGERTAIHISDYLAVPCQHMHGPSYVLSESDTERFKEAFRRVASAGGVSPLGYYRSNTRDTLQLGVEDESLLDAVFPADGAVCLLIKPYATKVSEAVFLIRSGGKMIPEGEPQLTFPFRRREMGGPPPTEKPSRQNLPSAEPPPERQEQVFGAGKEADMAALRTPPPAGASWPQAERPEPPAAVRQPVAEARPETESRPVFSGTLSMLQAKEPPVEAPTAPVRPRTSWVWIPLSFIFLCLGVVLGFQLATSWTARTPDPTTDPYVLGLTVDRQGENLHLKWSTESLAMRSATRGTLWIQDGDNQKNVEFTGNDLRRGGVLYRYSSGLVKFRLELFTRDRNSISEALDLLIKEDPNASAKNK